MKRVSRFLRWLKGGGGRFLDWIARGQQSGGMCRT